MEKQEWELLKEIREVKQLDPSKQNEYWNNKFKMHLLKRTRFLESDSSP